MAEDIFCATDANARDYGLHFAAHFFSVGGAGVSCNLLTQSAVPRMCRSHALNQLLKKIIGCLVCAAVQVAGLFPLTRAEKFCRNLGGISARPKIFGHAFPRRVASCSTFDLRFRILA